MKPDNIVICAVEHLRLSVRPKKRRVEGKRRGERRWGKEGREIKKRKNGSLYLDDVWVGENLVENL